MSTGPYWDGVVRAWDATPKDELWRAHSDAVNVALLTRWLPARVGRLLKTDAFDEAVAPGLVPFLTHRADAVTVVDVSAEAVDAARARHSAIEAVVADVRSLPFHDGSFDAVVSNSTLDHFESLADVDIALRELARVLVPGGTLIVTLDNRSNPLVAVRNALPESVRARTGLVPFRVGATCGARRLRRLLVAAGFAPDVTTAIVHCPRVLAVVAGRMVERRLGDRAEAAFLRALLWFEALEALPTRQVTGHFVAVRAERRSD